MARSVRIDEMDVRVVVRFLDSEHCLSVMDRRDRRALGAFQSAIARLDRPPTKARPKHKPRSAVDEVLHQGALLSRDVRRGVAKAEKRERRAAIREQVAKRAEDAGGFCECGCNQPIRDDSKQPCYPEARGEMDHFWGRGKGRPAESVETCWFLRPACHLAKTRSQPDAATWLRKFEAHSTQYFEASVRAGTAGSTNYSEEAKRARARLAFVETRSSLPAAPRLNR